MLVCLYSKVCPSYVALTKDDRFQIRKWQAMIVLTYILHYYGLICVPCGLGVANGDTYLCWLSGKRAAICSYTMHIAAID